MSHSADTRIVADRYEILHPLGRGAFGHTLLARDRDAGRLVALKVLDPAARGDWKARELFAREGAVLRDLRHHGIPQVHDVLDAEWEGATTPVLVMEYVDGESLERIIEDRRTIERADALHLFIELLAVLEYLHRRIPPILHRDIKPSNVIVRPDGTVALVDFGSVRSQHLAASESGSTIAGTYGYMPYEQFMGQASPTSDLFALAATMLHLLTGRPPRDFMSDDGRIEVPDDLPGGATLRDTLARMLRPAPVDRFRSAREVRASLLGEATTSPSALVVASAPATPGRRADPVPQLLLEPTPRALDDRAHAFVNAIAPGVMGLMDTSSKRAGGPSLTDRFGFVGLSIVTFGILPLIYGWIAHARRRVLRHFVQHGRPAIARISRIEMESNSMGEKECRVYYAFEADGAVHRDADVIMPRYAHRWQQGDEVQVLYIPESGYDSVIVSGV